MEMPSDSIQYLHRAVEPTRQQLLGSNVYQRLDTMADLRRFMEHHVFAVWDFMSLLKAMQRGLTCVAVPWVPTPNPATRRLINEIVLGEESDVDLQGRPVSHFELYVQAMEECGANTGPIKRFVAAITAGRTVGQALADAQVPASVREFVDTTFDIINSGRLHAVAAAFTFGREDLIPDMFRRLVGELRDRFPGQLDTFVYYLDRHIELEEVHAPLAEQMVRELCNDDPACWQECQQVAIRCLEARMVLWDGIVPVGASFLPA